MNITRPDQPQSMLRPHAQSPPLAVLNLLLEAYDGARAVNKPVWEFALEIQCLQGVGLTHTQVRWLMCQGFAEQALEESKPEDPQRRFRQVTNLSLVDKACFVLTESGAAYARAMREVRAEHSVPSPQERRPVWDRLKRELRVGGTVVKRFKQAASNQVLVLDAFEEEGWPPRIDDPLPPRGEQDRKRRVHTTISNLNRGHLCRLLHFGGGGDGESICWSLVSSDGDSEGRAKTGRV